MTSTLRQGRADAREVHRGHDENFPVLVALLPRAVRDDMRVVYAFCRHTDDLGDEGAPDERSARLEEWAADLERAIAGQAPGDSRLAALGDTIRRRGLDPGLFRRLVEANRMDQRTGRWATYGDLLHYCEHSATPVGRMVLGVLGYHDEWRGGLSDATCTGLQLVNFWQDVRRDLDERGRIYLPAEDMASFGVTEDDLGAPSASAATRDLIALEVGRARDLLVAGAPLARLVPPRAGAYLRMFTAGGLAICDAIAERGFDTVSGRPAPGRRGRAVIAGRALAAMARGRA